MAGDHTLRPAHGGYQDAFASADLEPIARELAAQVLEAGDWASLAPKVRAGGEDDHAAVQAALAALKWRFYAQPDFRAAVTR